MGGTMMDSTGGRTKKERTKKKFRTATRKKGGDGKKR